MGRKSLGISGGEAHIPGKMNEIQYVFKIHFLYKCKFLKEIDKIL